MRKQATLESTRRDAFIKHHFQVSHLTHQERDELGFLGEFACCDALGIDWKNNIRENYLTIDDFDFVVNGKRIDVKSETVPANYATKILNKTIKDDELYGRRLINKGQFSLLSKYDLVIFGMFIRDQVDYWHPIGFIETKVIIEKYPPTYRRPDGGNYPFPGSPVPTSILQPIENLTR
ncbi:hypothetical protein SKC37_09565 [Aquirufa sp. HETE-83D]|uniref:Uncharacterized protein n=1 Tax=Aquirufa esocilacus TaxID=3096513 RepID=A0ABW6DK67_9BACT